MSQGRKLIDPVALNMTLWVLTVSLGAVVATLAAESRDIPLWLQLSNAIVAALAAGQHLPSPRR